MKPKKGTRALAMRRFELHSRRGKGTIGAIIRLNLRIITHFMMRFYMDKHIRLTLYRFI
jgi:hypothetical protein